MKIYVASKFEDQDRVRETYETLRKAGHEITYDWTGIDDGVDKKKAAQNDYNGVMAADALVIYPHPNGKGEYTELGIALGKGATPVILIGTEEDMKMNIFFYHSWVVRVDSLERAIKLLNLFEKVWGMITKETSENLKDMGWDGGDSN